MRGDGYIHGYASREQQRLVHQAAHWRDELLLPGTDLAPGTRLLEVGAGVGAVLAVLGEAFPGIELAGVDIEPAQLAVARTHLAANGLEADLREADAARLPFDDASFDHVWMTWVLEHLPAPVLALREAHRVLVPGGAITVIEADYRTMRARPSSPAIDALLAALVDGMDATGRADAGAHAGAWLQEAGFAEVDPGLLPRSYDGDAVASQAEYVATVLDDLLPTLAELPTTASLPELEEGLRQLRLLGTRPGAHLEWTLAKAHARRRAAPAP
jgi:ubiquinone/menaquinone biosynthesis C-methylase UbiE